MSGLQSDKKRSVAVFEESLVLPVGPDRAFAIIGDLRSSFAVERMPAA
jgi:hypothetical protein